MSQYHRQPTIAKGKTKTKEALLVERTSCKNSSSLLVGVDRWELIGRNGMPLLAGMIGQSVAADVANIAGCSQVAADERWPEGAAQAPA